MILEVTKENRLFPLGMRFIFDKEQELFIGADEEDDVNDEYAFHTKTLYSFAIPTLLQNEEIFTEVKIEEKNENNQMCSGQEDTESKSEDIQNTEKQCNWPIGLRANSMCEEVQREEVEEKIEEEEVIRGSLYESRPSEISEEEYENCRKKDKRAIKLAVVDGALYNLITILTHYRSRVENRTWELRDAIEELRNKSNN